jgi:hypothetical protein
MGFKICVSPANVHFPQRELSFDTPQASPRLAGRVDRRKHRRYGRVYAGGVGDIRSSDNLQGRAVLTVRPEWVTPRRLDQRGLSIVGGRMLLVVQFPIADARPFVSGLSSKLDLPDWPSPTTELNPQFVRCFGPAVRRRRGPDAAWIDERVFCRASRALRFPELGRIPLGLEAGQRRGSLRRLRPHAWQFLPTCAFRRLLCDGAAVARVEVGVAHSSRATRLRGVEGVELFSIMRDFLELPTEVAQVNNTPTPRPLLMQGRNLARLYEQASTRSASTPNGSGLGLVESGMPLIVVEFERDEVKTLPAVRLVDPAKTQGAQLAFAWVKTERGTIAAWLLGRGSASPQQLRSLRLCLLRLHAEREALDLTLRQLRRGRVSFDPDSKAGDALQDYLNRATRVVQRDWAGGVSQSAILDAFDAAANVLRPEDRTDLAERLENSRNQVLRKLKAYEAKRAYVREIHALTYVEGDLVEHNEQIITGSTIIGNITNKVAAEKIENSFNTVANSGASAELKEALTLLNDEVKTLIRQMEDEGGQPEQVADVANLVETFTKQATEKRPLKEVLLAAGKGLVDAAKAVSERVTPIAGAVSAVLKLVGVAALI